MSQIHLGTGRAILLAAVLVSASGMTAAYAEPVPAQKEARPSRNRPQRGFSWRQTAGDRSRYSRCAGIVRCKRVALVAEVLPGSPAERAGLKAADANSLTQRATDCRCKRSGSANRGSIAEVGGRDFHSPWCKRSEPEDRAWRDGCRPRGCE